MNLTPRAAVSTPEPAMGLIPSVAGVFHSRRLTAFTSRPQCAIEGG